VRDFRVATVFEGTTEVHSIYPALLGIRHIEKWRAGAGVSPFSLAFKLARLLIAGEKWTNDFENAVMRKALNEARKCAGAARTLLIRGLLLHGRRIAGGRTEDLEFFLRRITTLSLYTFGLLALLSEARQKHPVCSLSSRDELIMRSFTAEAKEARRQNSRFSDSKRQRLDTALFRELDG
jgi:acyl-CoA dehydrogenase family protein 9